MLAWGYHQKTWEEIKKNNSVNMETEFIKYNHWKAGNNSVNNKTALNFF